MPEGESIDEGKIPDVGPLIENLLELATSSLRRTGDQAMGVWKEVTSGDYEPKYLARDAARFWARTSKDLASTMVLIRDFLDKVAEDDKPTESS